VLITVHALPFVNAGPARTICLNDSVSIGDTPAVGISYRWTPAAGLTSDVISQPIASPTVTTSYWLSDTDLVTGCFNRDTVLVTVNPLPIPWAGLDSTICRFDSAAIGDTIIDSGYAYRWIPGDGLNSDTIAAPMASPSVTTTYVVTDTIRATGCFSSDTVIVTIIPLPVADAGQDVAICIGDSVRIGTPDSPNVVYNWLPDVSLGLATIAMPMATPTVTTTYILLDTSTVTGCHNSDSVVVTVNSLPVTNAGVDTMVCLTDSIAIGTSQLAGLTYLWTPTTGLSSAVAGQPLASPAANTTYALKVTNTLTGCVDTDTMLLTVNPLPAANTGGDKAICTGENALLGATAVMGNTYKWTPNMALTADNIAQPTANPTATTVYTLTETNAHCSLSVPVTLTVNALPEAKTGPDLSIPTKASIAIGAEAVQGNSYVWLPNTNISSATDAMPTVTPAATTVYTLTETNDATGCKNTNTVKVEVSDKDGYNAFSPNGDGKNDTWKIPELKFFPENKVSILNRWGSEVWRGDNYDNNKVIFDGKNLAGENLPDGTYYYTITYGNVTKNGWVLIKR
jgi:gliding motility-associated-like protein